MSDEEKRDAQADLAMCEAATPEPWFERAPYGDGLLTHHEVLTHDPDAAKAAAMGGFRICEVFSPRNHRFIAEARTALPHWIKRAAAAEAEAERLKAILDELDVDETGQGCLLCARCSIMTDCDTDCHEGDHFEKTVDADEEATRP
jgi:hypothetical protein